jgi:hypothetical protein
MYAYVVVVSPVNAPRIEIVEPRRIQFLHGGGPPKARPSERRPARAINHGATRNSRPRA